MTIVVVLQQKTCRKWIGIYLFTTCRRRLPRDSGLVETCIETALL